MKRSAKFKALALSALLFLGSCGAQKQAQDPNSPNALINNIMSEAAAAQTTAAPKTTTAKTTSADAATENVTASAGDSSVDLDLTVMNSTMIYSVIYDIMVNPDNYYGKSLLVDGYFDTMENPDLGVRYYFIVVPDATACCVQGLEFILDGKNFPDDFPAASTDIRIRGVMDSYMEEGQKYCYIKADSLTVL